MASAEVAAPVAPSDLLPVISLSGSRSGDDRRTREVAAAIGSACESIGFFLIVDHGIDLHLIQRCRSMAREFFDLPLAEKMTVAARPGYVRGYQPLRASVAGYETDPDAPGELREDYAIGPVNAPNDDYHSGPQADGHFAPNLWPRRPTGLQESWTAYYQAMERLADDLARLFAVALNLPPDFFVPYNDRHISMLKAVNYPSQVEPPKPGEVRIRPHGDLGDFTILSHERSPGSLEVQTRAGDWYEVPEAPDAFVVNLGDLMMRWTNDRWISTKHRVVNPPRELAADSRRMSLPFFHQPNYDAVISCIPTCQDAQRPAQYPPVTSGNYLRERYLAGSRLTSTPG